MKASTTTITSCYQYLGKLFYAVAAIDKHIDKQEIDKLKAIVKEKWLPLEDSLDEFGVDSAYQIEIVFDWCMDNDYSEDVGKKYLQDFSDFKEANPKLFSKDLNELILDTSYLIASAFAGLDKTELVYLTKLQLVLKKS